MGRKRNPNKKTTEETIREALDKEQQNFIANKNINFESPSKKNGDARESFRTFWALVKKDYKKPKELEDILWAHLKASGFDKPDLFEKGLQHFGLKK